MPGRSLPSRYSRLAPPPVEMCPKASSSKPRVRTAAAESPPPTTERPSILVSASATARVPSAKASNSKTPIGPFQNTVLAPEIASAKAARGVGADVEPDLVVGDRVDARPRSATGSVPSDGNSGATTTSVGSTISTPVSAARREVLPAGLDLVLLEEALAHLVALRLEEGEHHAAADQQLVGLAEQVVDHGELVADLRAAEHDHVGPLGVLGQPAQHLDLVAHQRRPSRAAAAGVRRTRWPACGARPRTRR